MLASFQCTVELRTSSPWRFAASNLHLDAVRSQLQNCPDLCGTPLARSIDSRFEPGAASSRARPTMITTGENRLRLLQQRRLRGGTLQTLLETIVDRLPKSRRLAQGEYGATIRKAIERLLPNVLGDEREAIVRGAVRHKLAERAIFHFSYDAAECCRLNCSVRASSRLPGVRKDAHVHSYERRRRIQELLWDAFRRVHNNGSVFRLLPAGAMTAVADFDSTNASVPGNMVFGNDGNLRCHFEWG